MGAKKAVAKKAVPKKAVPKPPAAELPIVAFPTIPDWEAWLTKHHASAKGLWIELAKKGSGIASITYAEALELALAWGWIDGLKRSYTDHSWIQKFTPRGAKSLWSKINRDKALALIASGAMKPSGLAHVESAKKDGRWDAAYESPRNATVPEDLALSLAANARAKAFFDNLEPANRYAILFRVQTAKKPETRAARIAQFVGMCERHEKIHS